MCKLVSIVVTQAISTANALPVNDAFLSSLLIERLDGPTRMQHVRAALVLV